MVVAAGAAALSFRATADVAEQSGAVTPGWGWVVPLVVEAGVLTSAALAWIRTGEGTQARTELIVMGALLALSVVVNVSHADGTVLGKVLAAVPPVVLLVAVEGLLREQRRTAMKASDEVGAPLPRDDGPGRRGHEASWEQDVAAAWPATDRLDGSVAEPGPATLAGAEPAAAFLAAPSAGLVDTAEPVVIELGTGSAAPAGADAIATSLSSDSEPQRDEDITEGALPLEVPAGVSESPVADSPVSPTWPALTRPLSLVPTNGPMTDQELAIRIRQAVSRGVAVTGQTVAEWLDVSSRTGQRRLKKLTDTDPQLLRQEA